MRYAQFAEELSAQAAMVPNDEEVADEARRQTELAKAYAACERLMGQHGCIDFGDQVYRLLALLRARPSLLAQLRRRYRYILVDEFQDTNHGQFELLRLLSGHTRNITVVGDDDQAIYRFRGAAISNILQFCDIYPDARPVVLTQNFRSPQPLLDAAYRLVTVNNPDRLEIRQNLDKRLTGRDEPNAVPIFNVFDTESGEADQVAHRIAQSHASGRPYADHAILVRANRYADPYLRAMNVHAIPYRFTGNQGLYSRPEVRLLIAFMHATTDPHDGASLYTLAASEVYQTSPIDLALLCSLAQRRNRSLYEVMQVVASMAGGEAVAAGAAPRRRAFEPTPEDLALLKTLDDDTRATIVRLVGDLRRYARLAAWKPPGQVLYGFLRGSGWLSRLSRLDTPDDDTRLQNIARFFDIVREFEALDALPSQTVTRVPGPPLATLVNHLDQLIAAGDNPAVAEIDTDSDAVSVLTVHKSKGLEFPVVFLVGAVEGRFPARNRGESLALPVELLHETTLSGNALVQEERRLFYVAMTRARETLYISCAHDIGGRRRAKPSRFVAEALQLDTTSAPTWRASATSAIERSAPPDEVVPVAPAPVPDDQLLTLSHKQLDDYMTCPLKYKYVHILRVPLLTNHTVVYGRALHEAISCYNQARKSDLTVDPGAVLETFSRAWVNEGFLSPEHEEQRFEQGQKVLTQWMKREADSPHVPSLVEHEFSFLLERTRVVGRFDRVDSTIGPDGEAEATIIDYKSTDVRSREEADRRARENFQLAVYALAWHEREGRLPRRVELHFLASGQVGRARKSMRDLEETRNVILEAARGLRARAYPARPETRTCAVCAFYEICPATASADG